MKWTVALRESLEIAFSALRANKARGALTTLGIIIGIVENLASGYLDTLVPGGGTGAVLPFLVLLVVLLVKPYGLFGTKEIERV